MIMSFIAPLIERFPLPSLASIFVVSLSASLLVIEPLLHNSSIGYSHPKVFYFLNLSPEYITLSVIKERPLDFHFKLLHLCQTYPFPIH